MPPQLGLRVKSEFLLEHFLSQRRLRSFICWNGCIQSPRPPHRTNVIGQMSPKLPEHVSSRAHDIIITCVICPIVATVIVYIRVWTRIVVTRNLGWDDYAAIVTLLFCIGFSVVLGISTRYGMGLHLYDVRAHPTRLFPRQCPFDNPGTCLTGRVSLQHRSNPWTNFMIRFYTSMRKC